MAENAPDPDVVVNQPQQQQRRPGATAPKKVQPSGLYQMALDALSRAPVSYFRRNILLVGVPPNVLIDIHMKLANRHDLHKFVMMEMIEVDTIVRMVKYGGQRPRIISIVSMLMGQGGNMDEMMANQYIGHIEEKVLRASMTTLNNEAYMRWIDDGMIIGSFMVEAGWLAQSSRVLSTVLKVIHQRHEVGVSELAFSCTKLECFTRLLHAQARYLLFPRAEITFRHAELLVNAMGTENIPKSLLAMYYTKVSMLYFAKSNYDLSNEWGIKAVQQIDSNTPNKVVIDVLRQAAKACVLKREFKRGRMLIVQAVKIAKSVYGRHHHKYSDALLDYAFYLLSVDSITQSVNMYEESLMIRQFIYGQHNLYVAIAEEDLAYALYVFNYSSGRFKSAQEHVDRAINILRSIVPATHLSLASAKRVKALILEEIALDTVSMETPALAASNELLLESERLHQSALSLSLVEFGEQNVQTAKHYGNLGRLYQSMTKYYDAEQMHQRAIQIKTSILGPYDYEVGLSIGHLASLYNYHLYKFREAEKLYLNSISISLQLFGETYSGLEYDYRGLCHVYEMLLEFDKFFEYQTKLETWRMRRLEQEESEAKTEEDDTDEKSLEDITLQFFEMCSSSPGADTDTTDTTTTASEVTEAPN